MVLIDGDNDEEDPYVHVRGPTHPLQRKENMIRGCNKLLTAKLHLYRKILGALLRKKALCFVDSLKKI